MLPVARTRGGECYTHCSAKEQRASRMHSHATPDSTKRYADRFRGIATAEHFRQAHGLTVSSVGIGTYLGQPDAKTDGNYAASVMAAVENGLNVIEIGRAHV